MRQARTPYGGRRTGNPGLVSIGLIATNVAVWLAILATGWRESRLVERLALLPEGRCVSIDQPDHYYTTITTEGVCRNATGGDGDWFAGVAEGSYWQLLTNGFAHVELWHIGFNMLALWFLGPQLEAVFGRTRFLALYFVSLLSGSALVYWLAGEQSATLGASGAVFGLIGALLGRRARPDDLARAQRVHHLRGAQRVLAGPPRRVRGRLPGRPGPRPRAEGTADDGAGGGALRARRGGARRAGGADRGARLSSPQLWTPLWRTTRV
jgi:membrane associated rhomboid family serine protease